LQQITGLINDEGNLDPSRLGRLLVVRLSNGLWALWVDEVVGVMRLDQQHINSVPSTLKRKTQSLLQGVYQLNDKSVGLIDEDKLAQQLVKVLP
jgi:chemotaxis signal transduction protein